MKTGSIYIQHGFWISINRIGNEVFGPNVWDLFCVLISRKVHAEFPIELFKEDGLLSRLWQISGGSCFSEKGLIESILCGENNSIEDYYSVFFLDKEEVECKKMAEKKGVLCLNAEMLLQRNYLVEGKKISYAYQDKGSFYDLKKYTCLPCNSLIIIDPYILKENKYIKKHIKHLLNNIIPHTVNIPFHISFFSGIGPSNNASTGQDAYDEIINVLQEIRPKISFSLTLFQIPVSDDGWHDRFIITNNLMIEASAGFECFGRVEGELIASKAMHFDVYCPILSRSVDVDNYYIQINRASNESKKESVYYHNRFGSKENRLLDLV